MGIPDFRSKDTGLYSRLEHLGLSDPQEVFDINLFREDPSIFYSVAKDILPPSKKYTPTHRFIKILQENGKLLTNYTQNIDNLEQAADISTENLVQCHGSFATATCIQCKHKVPGNVIQEDLRAGKIAYCKECPARLSSLQVPGIKRKRISDSVNSKSKKRKRKGHGTDSTDDEDEDDDVIAPGVMKPDITFFGEALPSTFHDRLIKHDLELVDLVLVIGTSLKVAPVSEVVGVIPPDMPQIFISREPCNHAEFDIDLLGDCDVVVEALCRQTGWVLNHEMTFDGPINVNKRDASHSRFDIVRAVDGIEKPTEGGFQITKEPASVESQVDAIFDALKGGEDETEAIEIASSLEQKDVDVDDNETIDDEDDNVQEITKNEFKPGPEQSAPKTITISLKLDKTNPDRTLESNTSDDAFDDDDDNDQEVTKEGFTPGPEQPAEKTITIGFKLHKTDPDGTLETNASDRAQNPPSQAIEDVPV